MPCITGSCSWLGLYLEDLQVMMSQLVHALQLLQLSARLCKHRLACCPATCKGERGLLDLLHCCLQHLYGLVAGCRAGAWRSAAHYKMALAGLQVVPETGQPPDSLAAGA